MLENILESYVLKKSISFDPLNKMRMIVNDVVMEVSVTSSLPAVLIMRN